MEFAFVYFLTNSNSEIKIGHTANLNRRFGELDNPTGASSNLMLQFIGSAPCVNREAAKSLESQLHKKYRKLRVNKEWFKPSEELSTEYKILIDDNLRGNIAIKTIQNSETENQISVLQYLKETNQVYPVSHLIRFEQALTKHTIYSIANEWLGLVGIYPRNVLEKYLSSRIHTAH